MKTRKNEPDEEAVQRWLRSVPHRLERSLDTEIPGEAREQRMQRLFKAINYDLSLLIDEFGYEAVYFGVGCEMFPNAPVPWDEHGQY